MMTNLHRSLAAAAFTATLGLAVPTAFPAADVSPRAARKAAPDFTLADANGKPIKLSAYKGRVVLLDFWATWCAGCKIEIPWYMEFHKKYRARGLAAIGVAMDEEGWKTVKPYLVEHPISYPTVIGTLEFAKPYGVTAALPVTVLIDRSGKIAEAHVGMVEKDAFEKDILQLLREPAR